MELVILLLVVAIIGYFLAIRYSHRVDKAAADAAQKATVTTKNLVDKSKSGAKASPVKSKTTIPFKAWATGPGAPDLPDDFKTWLAGLSDPDAETFTRALQQYAASLGFKLDQLVNGELENNLPLKQAFLDAIVLYSQVYRKSQQARLEVSTQVAPAEIPAMPVDSEIPPAEKQSSRRKAKTTEETHTSPAD